MRGGVPQPRRLPREQRTGGRRDVRALPHERAEGLRVKGEPGKGLKGSAPTWMTWSLAMALLIMAPYWSVSSAAPSMPAACSALSAMLVGESVTKPRLRLSVSIS